jgi:hypothetical protein
MNLVRGYVSSVYFSIATAKTLNLVKITDNQLQGLSTASGAGVSVDATDTDSVTRVMIADCQIDKHNQGIHLEKNKWVSLNNLQFGDLSVTNRPIYLVSCKNIVGRQVFSTSQQTTDATATNVFVMGELSNDNVLKITMHALAKISTTAAVGSLRRDFLFKRTGGVTTLVASGTLVNDGGNLLPAAALDATVSGDRAVCRVTGIIAETWDWFINFDFELL